MPHYPENSLLFPAPTVPLIPSNQPHLATHLPPATTSVIPERSLAASGWLIQRRHSGQGRRAEASLTSSIFHFHYDKNQTSANALRNSVTGEFRNKWSVFRLHRPVFPLFPTSSWTSWMR